MGLRLLNLFDFGRNIYDDYLAGGVDRVKFYTDTPAKNYILSRNKGPMYGAGQSQIILHSQS